jgi:hypothetical protein
MRRIKRLFSWRCYGLVFWDAQGRDGVTWGWEQSQEDFLSFCRDFWKRNGMDSVRYLFIPAWMLWILGDVKFAEDALRDSGKWETVGQWQ